MKRSMIVSLLTLILCGSFSFSAKARRSVPESDTLVLSVDTILLKIDGGLKPEQFKKHVVDEKGKKKFVAALFAFPFPLGFMGAHRVMLGTKPWVPVVYVATFGGCFGILPLIDFCVITFSKDLTPYENNSNIFMWMK